MDIKVNRKMLDIAIKVALEDELPTTDGATNWLFRDLVSNYYKELCSLELMIEDEIRKTAELRSSVGPSEDETK